MDLNKLSSKNKKLREKSYSLEFLHRLLRMFSLLAGVATEQQSALGLLFSVITPATLTTFYKLLLAAPPRHKLLVLRILSSIS